MQKQTSGGICTAKCCLQAKNAAEYGVTVQGVQVDFGKVMERMRRLRASISPTDSCDRFQNQLSIDVFQVHKTLSSQHIYSAS